MVSAQDVNITSLGLSPALQLLFPNLVANLNIVQYELSRSLVTVGTGGTAPPPGPPPQTIPNGSTSGFLTATLAAIAGHTGGAIYGLISGKGISQQSYNAGSQSFILGTQGKIDPVTAFIESLTGKFQSVNSNASLRDLLLSVLIAYLDALIAVVISAVGGLISGDIGLGNNVNYNTGIAGFNAFNLP